MKLIELFTVPLLKANYVFSCVLAKKGLTIMPLAATLPLMIKPTPSVVVLLIVMALDFLTGVWASKERRKKEQIDKPELVGKSWVSSEKLKKSGGKFFLYASTILLAYLIEQVFFIKSFSVKFSDAQLTITVSVVIWWIVVELFSIFKENLPEIGFDVFKMFSKIINLFKSTVKEIKS